MAVKERLGGGNIIGRRISEPGSPLIFSASSLSNFTLDALGTEIVSIGFETAEAIDDLNVRLVGEKTAYLQAKRKLSYSLATGSDLHTVLKLNSSSNSRNARARHRHFFL